MSSFKTILETIGSLAVSNNIAKSYYIGIDPGAQVDIDYPYLYIDSQVQVSYPNLSRGAATMQVAIELLDQTEESISNPIERYEQLFSYLERFQRVLADYNRNRNKVFTIDSTNVYNVVNFEQTYADRVYGLRMEFTLVYNPRYITSCDTL